ncbi:MAG: isochorismatase family protein, partial [Acidimicrobiia bacterium]|nr:isochorismatase family protein [Acidimicrobiia bacterium]
MEIRKLTTLIDEVHVEAGRPVDPPNSPDHVLGLRMSTTDTAFSEYRVVRDLEFDPARTAVLVIDMLNDFLEPEGAMPLLEGQGLYEPIRRLLAAARENGARVIWVCDEHPLGDSEFAKRSV